MTARLRRAIWIMWRFVLAAIVAFSALLVLWVTKALPWPQRSFDLKKIRAAEGVAFTSKISAPWPGFTYVPRSAILTEGGRGLTPVNENSVVRENGGGTFRMGGERVLFSTSDGTDPLMNGRKYRLRLPTMVPPFLRPFIFCGGGLAALLLLGKRLFVFAAWLRRAAVESRDGATAISASAWAFILFAFALAIRLGFLWLNPEYTDEMMAVRGVPYSDARCWNEMAKTTATGLGVDSTFPGMRALYPMFLANFYTWFGPSLPLAKGLQALIGAATTAVIFLALRRAMPVWPALAAALFFAVDPRQVTQAGRLMTEPLGLLFTVLSAWCLIVGGETRRRALLFASGAFFACSNLTRPLTLFVFPLFLALIAAQSRGRWREALPRAMAFALGTIVCLAPWVVREHVTHGFWGISSNSSSALFAASTPEFGTWSTEVEALAEKAKIPYEVKTRYDFYQGLFRENLRKYPGFYTANVARSFREAALGCANPLAPLLGALGLLALLAARRGGAVVVLSALFAALLLACANAPWMTALACAGLAFTLWWRSFPGAALLVCYLGTMCGSALFGNPDLQRMRLLIDWLEAGWMFAGLFAIGSLLVALLLRIPLRESGLVPAIANRESGGDPPPSWLRWTGWAFAGFLIVSTARLVVLNGFTTHPRAPNPQLTDPQRTAFLQDFTSRFPAWQRLADPALLAAPRSWRRRAFVEFGAVERDVYRFPAGSGFHGWQELFAPRRYEHTGFIFRMSPPVFAERVWMEFAGEIPTALRETRCMVIGLAKVRPRVAAYLENSVEVIAIIPAPDFQPDFTRAIVAPVFPETEALLAPQ